MHAVSMVRAQDADALSGWLGAGGDPNQHDGDGWTPLLVAAARGYDAMVLELLDHGADPALPHTVSGALPIHMAGHSGSVAVADAILERVPDHLDAVWDINGHTLLLQAAFYGHLDLAADALNRGANTAATTLRGLGAREFALQFANTPFADLVEPYDRPAAEKQAYYAALLERLAPVVPPEERPEQDAADALSLTITAALAASAGPPAEATDAVVQDLQAQIDAGADVNRLAGPLAQPPLVVAVTGHNGIPADASTQRLREHVAATLIANGADPLRQEVHPMGADAFIRASVFNHLAILQMMGDHVSAEALAGALNAEPVVNGLTALHDSVLRASMVGPDRLDGYLAQIRWSIAHGARYDIEDFSGRTQLAIAEAVPDPVLRKQLLAALGVTTT